MNTCTPWRQNKGFRQLARLESLPGAGQVVVEGEYAYIAHMTPPLGPTILDISDRKSPRIVTQIEVPPNNSTTRRGGTCVAS